MFKTILIANRGEIAVRIIRACKELGIKTAVIYSEADKDAQHVWLADNAVCVGAGPNQDSYMNLANVIMAANITKSEAIHPGYAYFSEQAQFAEACAVSGFKFIGPSSEAIMTMGDKSKARETVSNAEVPVVPGTKGAVINEQDALKEAQKIGFPVLIKASAGGGGRGIRRVDNPDELPRALKMAESEALSSFGDGEVYIEKCLIEPRHVEFQIIADEHGNVLHLGERECSIQNLRHQKVIEESPAVDMSSELRQRMGDTAVRAAKAVKYTNAGTVEFLLDSTGEFYFMEMNTRLQVEHPITEMVTCTDIVKLQIAIASGEPLPMTQSQVEFKGHAIEARINAVDPKNGFAPSIGKITKWIPPGGPGIRIDTFVHCGATIPPFYDSMIAKLIVFDKTRKLAIARLRRALGEFIIEGVHSNIEFLKQIVEYPDYIEGNLSTGLVPKMLKNGSASAKPFEE